MARLGAEARGRIAAGLESAHFLEDHPPMLVRGLLRTVLEVFAGNGLAMPAEAAPLARKLSVVDGLVAIGEGEPGSQPLAAVCAALGVKLRTLNAYSTDILGMGAGQYLRRRRMHRVLARLRQGDVSVREAAMAEGFTELGRFAGEFRALFGCLPSQVRGA